MAIGILFVSLIYEHNNSSSFSPSAYVLCSAWYRLVMLCTVFYLICLCCYFLNFPFVLNFKISVPMLNLWSISCIALLTSFSCFWYHLWIHGFMETILYPLNMNDSYAKQILVGSGYQWEGKGKCRVWAWPKYFINMYENRTMKSDKIVWRRWSGVGQW
jgi:hypothetical protein